MPNPSFKVDWLNFARFEIINKTMGAELSLPAP